MVLLVLECLLELLDESILPRFLRQLNERLPAGVVGQLRDEGGLHDCSRVVRGSTTTF